MNVIDWIAEALMENKPVPRPYMRALVNRFGYDIDIESDPSHEVCELTGEEGPCHLVGARGSIE